MNGMEVSVRICGCDNASNVDLPLSSFTVVEVCTASSSLPQRIAVAMAGKIARDLGAHVFAVYGPDGDPLGAVTVEPYERSPREAKALSTFLNSGKEAILLSRHEREDCERIADIVTHADALLISTGVAENIALKAPVTVDLAVLPPNISTAVPPSELGLFALSGMLDLVGTASREPLMLGGHQAAYSAGCAAFSAMMTGFAEREFQGRDAHLVVDMLNVLMWLNWKALAAAEITPSEIVSREGEDAPWRTVPCADGHVAVVYNDRDLPQIFDLLADDDGLPGGQAYLKSRATDSRHDLMEAIKRWCAPRTRRQITDAAQRRSIPFGPVLLPHELLCDPQLIFRQSFASVVTPGSDAQIPVLPLRWNGKPVHAPLNPTAVSVEAPR
ncbi:MAG: CoA transferase [Xanthobacteraceae bacterium]|nr:CoA transferase [Xanthobacteraceae bacterium]